MLCHMGRCPGTCNCTATGTGAVSPHRPTRLAGVAGAILSPTTILYCPLPPLRYLCDKVVPGNRVTIMGIYSIKKSAQSKNKSRDNVGVGIRSAYIRVVGIQVDVEGSGEGCFWCPSGLCW